MKYDRTIRWIHAGLALTVLIQLACSLWMEVTRPGHLPTQPGHALFQIHRWSGISVAVLLLVHWLWLLGGHVANGWGHLFPWFSPISLRKLKSDLKATPNWMRNGFPDQKFETLPIAGAVHGLGLLTVSVMALSGATIFFAMAPDGGMAPFALNIMEFHGFIASFVWAYVVGHAGMALYHQLQGNALISDMFNLARK